MINIKVPHICLFNTDIPPSNKPKPLPNKRILHQYFTSRKKSSALDKKPQKIQFLVERAEALKTIQQHQTSKNTKTEGSQPSKYLIKIKKEYESSTKNYQHQQSIVSRSLYIPKNVYNSLTERSSNHSKWKKSILRRKNNGSQGKIITGLPGKRHSFIVERAKVLISHEQSPQDPQKPRIEEQIQEKFKPIGSVRELHDSIDTGDKPRYQIDRLKLTIRRKITNNSSINYEEYQQYRVKTQFQQQQSQRSVDHSSRLNHAGASYFRKLKSQLNKGSKKLAPWSMNS